MKKVFKLEKISNIFKLFSRECNLNTLNFVTEQRYFSFLHIFLKLFLIVLVKPGVAHAQITRIYENNLTRIE